MQNTGEGKSVFGSLVKGCLASVIITLVSVLLFAIIVKVACLNSGAIKAVNQFIKVLSVFLACFFTVKGKGGIFKGGIIGAVSAVITYLVFALIGGELSFGLPFVIDIIFQLVVGAISGIIAVNVKNK